jgi:outer membrane protein assembly factor BamB
MINKIRSAKKLGLLCLPLVLIACASQSPQKKLTWKIELDGGCAAGASAASAPLMHEGVIYIGSSDGAIYAISADSGEQMWRLQTGVGLPSGTGIIVESDASNAADMLGKALEQTDQHATQGMSQITATPIFHSNTILIGSWDQNFYAIDAITGKSKWVYAAKNPIMEKAVIYGDKVIFVTGGRQSHNSRGDGLVYALDVSSGKSVWTFDTLYNIQAKTKLPIHLPIVKDESVYVINWDANRFVQGAPDSAKVYAYAINANTGKARWSNKINAAWPSPPAVTDKHVLFLTSSREVKNALNLHALDRATGQEKWVFRAIGGKEYWKLNSEQGPLIADGNTAILITDIAVIGVDLDTGNERWRVTEAFQTKPINKAYLGPLLYILTGDTLAPTIGEFYALDPQTGKTKWSMSMNSRNRIRNVIDDVIYLNTAILRNALIALDGISGEDLGTAWTLGFGAFTNESYSICAGPVRYGDQLLVATELQITFGAGISHGHLYSVRVPTRISQKKTHQ